MAKNWTVIRTDKTKASTKAEQVKKAKKAAKAIAQVKTKSYDDLRKEGNDVYAATVAREDSILAAAEGNKLQSESLKKEAASIAKHRAAAASKKKEQVKEK